MARPFKGTTFWDRVNMHVVIDEKGCHLFNGHLDECGYGRISRDGKLVRVHREVWKLHHPDQEITGVIMHSCDTPNCVNPEHLSHGTQADNIADMVAKGRRVTVKGSAQKDSKLTEADIPVIRNMLATGVTGYRISKIYKVSEQVIRNIKQGKNWTHVK
jgi:hypothetical protein